jgi:hypothetical protein
LPEAQAFPRAVESTEQWQYVELPAVRDLRDRTGARQVRRSSTFVWSTSSPRPDPPGARPGNTHASRSPTGPDGGAIKSMRSALVLHAKTRGRGLLVSCMPTAPIPLTTRSKIMAEKGKHPSTEHHHEAAARHAAAAHHHHQAAHHHEYGEHDKAKQHATSAHQHSEKAHGHTKTAHEHSHK